jgi:hypothetical protein
MRTQPDNHIVALINLEKELLKTYNPIEQTRIANQIIAIDEVSIEDLRKLYTDFYNYPELKILFRQAITTKAAKLVTKT